MKYVNLLEGWWIVYANDVFKRLDQQEYRFRYLGVIGNPIFIMSKEETHIGKNNS
jgi:hypothetical protein